MVARYVNIVVLIDCENKEFLKKWIMIITWNLPSGTKLPGWPTLLFVFPYCTIFGVWIEYKRHGKYSKMYVVLHVNSSCRSLQNKTFLRTSTVYDSEQENLKHELFEHSHMSLNWIISVQKIFPLISFLFLFYTAFWTVPEEKITLSQRFEFGPILIHRSFEYTSKWSVIYIVVHLGNENDWKLTLSGNNSILALYCAFTDLISVFLHVGSPQITYENCQHVFLHFIYKTYIVKIVEISSCSIEKITSTIRELMKKKLCIRHCYDYLVFQIPVEVWAFENVSCIEKIN